MSVKSRLVTAVGTWLILVLPASALPPCPNLSQAQLGDGQYRLLMADGADFCMREGAVWIYTGPQHPVTLASGAGHSVIGPSLVSLRSYSAGEDYLIGQDLASIQVLPQPGDLPTHNLNLVAPHAFQRLTTGGIDTGGAITWALDRADRLDITIEAQAVGTDFTDSAVRVMLSVSNLGSAEAHLGARVTFHAYLDTPPAAVDARVSWQVPDVNLEPYADTEAEWSGPLRDVLYLTPTSRPSQRPDMFSFSQVLLGPSCGAFDPAPTPPEVVQSAHRGFASAGIDGMWRHPFDWEIPMPPRLLATNQSSLAFYWGRYPSTAVTVAPGETVAWTLYFSSWPIAEPHPATALPDVPGGGHLVVECAGDQTAVPLSAVLPGNPATSVAWESVDGSVTFDPPDAHDTIATVMGLSLHEVELAGHLGAWCSRRMLELEVVDTTPPAFAAFPVDAVVSCDAVPMPEAPLIADACDEAPSLLMDETSLPGACADEQVIERTWTATDATGNAATATQVLTVVDHTAPATWAALVPVEPLPPRSAQAAASACSPPSSRLFRVEYAANDACDPAPAVTAVLRTWWQDESVAGCPVEELSLPVSFGDLVELRVRALRTPCRARGVRSARGPAHVDSRGVFVVEGLRFELEAQATDRCGQVGVATADPAVIPSVWCDEVLLDGTCCPALAGGAAVAAPATAPLRIIGAPRVRAGRGVVGRLLGPEADDGRP